MSEIILSIANGGTGASKKRMSIEQIIANNLTITDPHLYDGVFNAVSEAVEAERQECADVLLNYAERDDLSDSDQSLLKHLFELICLRGDE